MDLDLQNWFSDNAMAKLLQGYPELGSYIMSFNDMTEELPEDSGVNVGVFVLRVGQDFLFVPVVAKNNTIFPLDSVFVNSIKKFMPLTKNTALDIIASASSTLGKKTNIPASVPLNPSVYEMINPPKTGKFAYASTGRLMDFLSAMPNELKVKVRDDFLKDKEVYNTLNRMFGLEDVLVALKPTVTQVTEENPLVQVIVSGPNLSPNEVTEILNDGYAVRGQPVVSRIAIVKQDWENSKVQQITFENAAYQCDLALRDGSIRKGYVPALHTQHCMENGDTVVLFDNGDYALNSGHRPAVMQGEKDTVDNTFMERLFMNVQPKLLRDVNLSERFALFEADKTFLGVFQADKVVNNALGTTLYVNDLANRSDVKVIRTSRNIPAPVLTNPGEFWVRSYSYAIPLNRNVVDEVENSPQAVTNRINIKDLDLLGEQLVISHDGVEFCLNGNFVGGAPEVAKALIIGEQLDPHDAREFIKSAMARKSVTLYMSKRASDDVSPSEVPSYGAYADNDRYEGEQLPGSNTPSTMGLSDAIQGASPVNDSDVMQATIMSQLLQAPDMVEVVSEYLPDIQECLDRLGRILFLCRIHVAKLSDKLDSETLSTNMNNIRSVYRNLGDSYVRLKRMTATGL